jgi:hypothetical protein
MKTKILFILISNIIIFQLGYSQTYRKAFDRYEAVDHDYSYDINISGQLNANESFVLESYIMMWKATHDTKYLNKFIIHTKRLQDHRDDKVAANLYGVNGLPASPTCSQLYSYPHDNYPVWSFDDDCSTWIPRVLHSGNIIYPMAEFIYLMLNDPQTSLETVPNEVGLSSVVTFLDFAYWLQDRVVETLNFHQFNWSCNDVAYHTNWYETYGCGNNSQKDALNMQCAMGRALIMMYLVQTMPNNSAADNGIIELCSNHLTNIAHLVREELNRYNSNFFTWSHNYQHTIIEDIGGHANLIMEFADLCYTYDIRDFYDNSLTLFSLNDMEKFGRTFAEHIYQNPLHYAKNTFGTNAVVNPVEDYHIGLYVFLSKYNRYVYQQISDYFCSQAIYNSGSLSIGFAELAYYETLISSTSGLPINIFNPIAVARSNSPMNWRSCASGDFDGDGNDEFLFQYNHYLTMNAIDQNRNTNLVAITQTIPQDLIDGMAVGRIGTSSSNLIAAICKTSGGISLFNKNGSNIQLIAYSSYLSGHEITAITVGDFDPSIAGEEIAVYCATDGKIYLFTYNGFTLTHIALSNNFLGWQVAGISAGKFDGSNSDQIATVDNLNGTLRIVNFQSGSINLLYEYTQTAGTNNIWNGITTGDFDGDGLDEIIAHRDYDGQFLVFKIKNGQLVNEYGEYFPIDQGNGIFCSAHLNQLPYKDALISFRNYDGQITFFNMNGLCQGIDLDNIAIDASSSIDNPYFTGGAGTNDYSIDYHSPNTILAGNNFSIEPDGKATLVSGKEIIFNPGFISETGSELYAYIDNVNLNCGNHEFFKLANPHSSKGNLVENKLNDLNVIPNPTNGPFKIEIENYDIVKDIFIYDLMGKKIYYNADVKKPTIEVDLSNYPKGIYFLKVIDDDDNFFSYKLILS